MGRANGDNNFLTKQRKKLDIIHLMQHRQPEQTRINTIIN